MSSSSRTYEIVPVIPGHVRFLSSRLRQSDCDEIWAAVGTDPASALEESVAMSRVCRTIVLGGAPAAIFGAASYGNSPFGVAWLLGSGKVVEHPRAFWLASKAGLGLLFTWYAQLFNYVDARNTTSLRWLKRLGAQIAPPQPFGIEARPFHYFEFER